MISPKNIMLVDDDEIFTYIVRKIIDESNLAKQILVFGNGKDAIHFLQERAQENDLLPDVIFLDLTMPVLDGWGFLDQYFSLKPKLDKDIVLYVVSTSVSPLDYQRAKKNSDVSDFIVKPMGKDQFIDIIKNLS